MKEWRILLFTKKEERSELGDSFRSEILKDWIHRVNFLEITEELTALFGDWMKQKMEQKRLWSERFADRVAADVIVSVMVLHLLDARKLLWHQDWGSAIFLLSMMYFVVPRRDTDDSNHLYSPKARDRVRTLVGYRFSSLCIYLQINTFFLLITPSLWAPQISWTPGPRSASELLLYISCLR